MIEMHANRETANRETVTIACRASIRERLELDGGPAAVQFIELEEGRDTWDLPPQADVLITQTTDWKTAPPSPPPGWSRSLTWVHALSAGVDAYPSWIFDVTEPTCGRGSSSVPIAEYVLAAILHHEKRLAEILVTEPAGWKRVPLGTVAGKTIGLFGIGAIGLEVAKRALAFDARVVALRRSARPLPLAGIETATSPQDLVSRVDHLVLAAPLTSETRYVIDRALLAGARRGLHLINVSRGALIRDDHLVEALDAGILSAATLDVTNPEPPEAGHPLYGHPGIRLTPHVSWYADDANRRMSEAIQANLERYVRGLPLLNRVDISQGY